MESKEDIPLRLSRWAFVYEQDDLPYIAIYHSLNIDLIFLEKRFKDIINCLQKGTTISHLVKKLDLSPKKVIIKIIDEMMSKGLVTEIFFDDMIVLKQKLNEAIFPPGLLGMYLILSDECNLRCQYCFINKNMPTSYKRSLMTFPIAKKAVDIFFKNIDNNPEVFQNYPKTIFFYGGEPLLNFNLIRDIIEYIQTTYSLELEALDHNFQYALITNGTLITEEIAGFLAQHKEIDIGISIDGRQNTHDQKRIYRNGKGSFNRAIKGYELLKKAGCTQVSVSCTIDEHNIDELESLLDLNKIYGFNSINFNLLLDTREKEVDIEYIRRASKRLLSYFEHAREEGVYEGRVIRKLKSFITHKIHPSDCMAIGNQIVCSPDGQIGICHEGIGLKQFFFTHVDAVFDFHNNPTIKEWNQRSPLTMPQCFNCPAIGICGGGCAYSAYLRNGSIRSVDDRFCIHSLETLEWMIWDLYKIFE